MASTVLYRDNVSSGATKITFSAWVKRSGTGNTNEQLFSAYTSNDRRAKVYFTSDRLQVWLKDSSGNEGYIYTNRLFRDTNAWYHIVIAQDNSLSPDTDRIKIYVNGARETSVTWSGSKPYQGSPTWMLGFGKVMHGNGYYNGSYESQQFNGLMSHIHVCYGYAYSASDFGSTDSTTGEWKINTSPNVQYGTNGYTILKDGNTITDQSTNSNNFTLGAGTLTKSEDNPSNVFATWNPLDSYYIGGTPSNGNTTWQTNNSDFSYNFSTLGMTSGKYYAEIKCTADTGSNDMLIGIASTSPTATTQELGHFSNNYGYYASNGNYRSGDSNTAYGTAWTVGAIICIAVDLDNNKLYFRRDANAWENSGNPASGSTGTGAISITDPTSTSLGAYFFSICNWSSSTNSTFQANFGNGYFGTTAVSSAGTNASGNGIFEYDVPTGFTALSTKGLNL